MKPQDDGPASGPEKPSKPSRTEEALRIVGEYADDLREILKNFRKLFNWPHFRPLSFWAEHEGRLEAPFEYADEQRECLFIGVDRKSSADSQNVAFHPSRTLGAISNWGR